MFYVRINKVSLKKNGELLGKGEVQLMSFINYSEDDFPSLQKFFDTNDDEQKAAAVRSAIEKVVNSRIMMPIAKVRDNSVITFGDTGYIVYKSKIIPEDFSWMILAVESDKKTRDTAALLQTVLTEDNVSSLIGTIAKLAATADPVTESITAIYKFVSKTAFGLSANDKDDQVGYYLCSFIRGLDYPHGNREVIGSKDTTGNMTIDYSFFGFESYAAESVS
ncbi:MAG: hypothetical protein CFE23_08450 [Flavobacterium sp. BFFFF1]|nr:MAG: hypothetical protein CFE23_08450 [Flavobacterium sp. BFFFF1]